MHLHSEVELPVVLSVFGHDGKCALPGCPRQHDLGGGEGDGADELGEGVVLVAHLEGQLVGVVAHVKVVYLVPDGVQVVGDYAGEWGWVIQLIRPPTKAAACSTINNSSITMDNSSSITLDNSSTALPTPIVEQLQDE